MPGQHTVRVHTAHRKGRIYNIANSLTEHFIRSPIVNREIDTNYRYLQMPDQPAGIHIQALVLILLIHTVKQMLIEGTRLFQPLLRPSIFHLLHLLLIIRNTDRSRTERHQVAD